MPHPAQIRPTETSVSSVASKFVPIGSCIIPPRLARRAQFRVDNTGSGQASRALPAPGPFWPPWCRPVSWLRCPARDVALRRKPGLIPVLLIRRTKQKKIDIEIEINFGEMPSSVSSFARNAGFRVSLAEAGTRTRGVICCDQPRLLDLVARSGRRLESVPQPIPLRRPIPPAPGQPPASI